MNNLTRRDFVKSTVAVSAAMALPFSKARGANDDLRVGVAGVRGRGGGLADEFNDLDGVRLVALCDVDSEVLDKRVKQFKDRNGKVAGYGDYRRMLEDKSIDIVAVATPDHWHTPIAAASVVAGKDVYVEKPLSHTIAEGRLLVSLARKHGRIVQHGTQARSSSGIREGIEYLKSGKLGKIRMAKAIDCQLRGPIGREPDSETPPGVNYDLWLGPAPKRPFNKNRLGVGMPKAVSCSGTQLFYDDDHETPDTQVATFEYEDVYLMYEMRLWTPYGLEGHDNGDIFYGDEGTMSIGRKGWQVIFKNGKEGPSGSRGSYSHAENFIKAVRSRKASDLNADVEVGHRSATLCHMANIAMRVGRRLKFDAANERFIDDAEANTYLTKQYRKGYELPTL